MRRKVSRIGPATLMVSLPSKWVKKYGVKKGDEMELIEKEHQLIFQTNSTMEVKRLTINFNNSFIWIMKWLMNIIYKLGYDEIEINLKDQNLMADIQKNMNLNTLYGFEIISYDNNKCVLKEMSAYTQDDFQLFYRRCFNVTIDMLSSCVNILKNKNYDELKNILVLEETNNKLVSACERMINKQNIIQEKKVFYYITVWLLEKTADIVKDFANYILEQDDSFKINEKTLNILLQVEKLYSDFFIINFNPSIEKFKELNKNRKIVSKEIEKLIQETPKNHVKLLFLIRDMNEKLSEFTGSFIGVNLEKLLI